MPSSIHSGSCLCGGVRFEATEPLRAFTACHCTQCRKQSGHFAAMTSVPLDQFQLTRDDSLAWYQATAAADRGFCKTCGSLLFWRPEGEERMAICGGAFDGPTGVRIEMHIFCADKGDYYEIADGARQYAQD